MKNKHKVETTYTKTEAISTCNCGFKETFRMGGTDQEMNEWIKKCTAHVPNTRQTLKGEQNSKT